MKLLKLNTLALRNFKGQRSFTIEPQGQGLTIYGDNATGKTTLADAWFWLLFGKDSQSKKDFSIKTIDPKTGEVKHNLEHTVEGTLDMSGAKVSLKKVYAEKWVKTRGSAVSEFSGHSTTHTVNGVPATESEYTRQVGEICDEKRFRLLSDPTHFNTVVTWQDRRKALLEVCGDVSDEDVIAANPKLADLPSLLEGHTTDDMKKIIAARRKATNAEITGIPDRIDECQRQIGEIDIDTAVSENAFQNKLSVYRKDLDEAMTKHSRITSGGEIAECTKQIAEIQGVVQLKRNRLAAEANAAGAEAHTHVNTSLARINQIELDIEKTQQTLTALMDTASKRDLALGRLRQEWQNHSSLAFTATEEAECAACGQALPAEKVEAARAKAEALFNSTKARLLEENLEEGKAAKKHKELLLAEMALCNERLEGLEQDLVDATDQWRSRKAVAEGITIAEPVDTQEIIEELAKIARLETTIAELRTGTALHLEASRAEIEDIRAKIADAEAAHAKVAAAQKAQDRIKELETDQKRLAKLLEADDRGLFLIEDFIRTKVSMLTEKINSKFSIAQFRLFEEQVNGGLAECCITTVNGVGYPDLNTGTKLNVGLDIIDTLAEHFGFAPPIIIDNAESVTSIRPTHGQQIQLVVSAADKALRVESAQTQERLAI